MLYHKIYDFFTTDTFFLGKIFNRKIMGIVFVDSYHKKEL